MRICVFGSSSKVTAQPFLDEAYKLGELLAERNHICVNGGGMFGVMGAVNRGCHSKNGQTVGIIHERFVVDVQVDTSILELIVTRTDDLNERKQLLYDNADCFVVMAGGLGTFDEIFDCLGARSLNMKKLTNKPMVIVNVDGFYDGIEQQLNRAYKENVLYSTVDDYAHFVTNIQDAVDWCEKIVPPLILARQDAHNNVIVGARTMTDATAIVTKEDHNVKLHNTTSTTTITSVHPTPADGASCCCSGVNTSAKNTTNGIVTVPEHSNNSIATIDTLTIQSTVPDNNNDSSNGHTVRVNTNGIIAHKNSNNNNSNASFWMTLSTGICVGSLLTLVAVKSLRKLK